MCCGTEHSDIHCSIMHLESEIHLLVLLVLKFDDVVVQMTSHLASTTIAICTPFTHWVTTPSPSHWSRQKPVLYSVTSLHIPSNTALERPHECRLYKILYLPRTKQLKGVCINYFQVLYQEHNTQSNAKPNHHFEAAAPTLIQDILTQSQHPMTPHPQP